MGKDLEHELETGAIKMFSGAFSQYSALLLSDLN